MVLFDGNMPDYSINTSGTPQDVQRRLNGGCIERPKAKDSKHGALTEAKS